MSFNGAFRARCKSFDVLISGKELRNLIHLNRIIVLPGRKAKKHRITAPRNPTNKDCRVSEIISIFAFETAQIPSNRFITSRQVKQKHDIAFAIKIVMYADL